MSSKILKILELLDKKYGKNVICFLNYQKDYELLFATILAAQCTDARVNSVTKELFVKYNTLEKFASAELVELEKDIYETGFYRNKANSIKKCANELINSYSKRVPDDIDELVKLPGVGRKTANVVLTHIFNQQRIVVDTHVKRTSRLLGMTNNIDPVTIEYDLMEVIPKEHWSRLNCQLMTLGRTLCIARKPKCEECFLKKYCDFNLSGKNY